MLNPWAQPYWQSGIWDWAAGMLRSAWLLRMSLGPGKLPGSSQTDGTPSGVCLEFRHAEECRGRFCIWVWLRQRRSAAESGCRK